MKPQEAITILRGTASPQSVLHPQIASDMGADAIELIYWWFDEKNEEGREAVRMCREKANRPWDVSDWVDAIKEEMKSK